MKRNNNIGKILKYYRKLHKIPVKKVSELLEENQTPAAEKTIYGWESGHTQPNADILLFLCKVYRIENILQAFGYEDMPKEPVVQPTDHEYELLKQYRKHPEMHSAVHKLLDL